MLRTNDYREIYQAYIDTVRFHIDSNSGVIMSMPINQITEVPAALSLIDFGNEFHNIPDYFDFMASLIKNNSYWLFSIDKDNNALEGKHRMSALHTLMKHKMIGSNTAVLTGVMESERDDTRIDVFLPNSSLGDYVISMAHKRFKKQNIIFNTENIQTRIFNGIEYRVEQLTLHEFMAVYNICLKNDFINNNNISKEVALNSILFDFVYSEPKTLVLISNWKQGVINKHNRYDSYWSNNTTPQLYQHLYGTYTGLLEQAEYDTNQEGNSIYRIIPWADLQIEYNIKKLASPLFDWFTPLTETEKKDMVNIVAQHNFPFVIFLQTYYGHISALSTSIMSLLQYGVDHGILSSDFALKVIVVHKQDRPDVHYCFPGTIPTPNLIPIQPYLIDFIVYDRYAQSYTQDGIPMLDLSARFFDTALHWYEHLLWKNISQLATSSNKIQSIIWA